MPAPANAVAIATLTARMRALMFCPPLSGPGRRGARRIPPGSLARSLTYLLRGRYVCRRAVAMGDSRQIAMRLVVLGTVLLTTSCVSAPPRRPFSRADGEPPRIVPPPRGKQAALAPRDYGALPKGARARLPARDGDPIVVVLSPTPLRELTAESVRDEVIAPILKAAGFKAGLTAFRMPPSRGIVLPAPSFAPLAEAVAFDYAANPRLHGPLTRNMLDVFLGRRPVDERVDRAIRVGEGMTFEQF